MLQLTLNPATETRIKNIVGRYAGDYERFFSDLIGAYLAELQKGLRNIELDLRYFEQKYRMSSGEFYDKFDSGALGDDNADFFQWSGEYEIWRDQQQELQDLRQ